jgi:hypothetical protein
VTAPAGYVQTNRLFRPIVEHRPRVVDLAGAKIIAPADLANTAAALPGMLRIPLPAEGKGAARKERGHVDVERAQFNAVSSVGAAKGVKGASNKPELLNTIFVRYNKAGSAFSAHESSTARARRRRRAMQWPATSSCMRARRRTSATTQTSASAARRSTMHRLSPRTQLTSRRVQL